MFELGAGNAQGSAAGMAIGPRTREELENMKGIDTEMLVAGGIPYGPLGRAAGMQSRESMKGVDTEMLLAGGMPYGPLGRGR
jgi:hypothetical protein